MCQEWIAWLFDHSVLSTAVIYSILHLSKYLKRNKATDHSYSDEQATGEFYFVVIFSLHPPYEHVGVTLTQGALIPMPVTNLLFDTFGENKRERETMSTKKSKIFHSSQTSRWVGLLSHIYICLVICTLQIVKENGRRWERKRQSLYTHMKTFGVSYNCQVYRT
jgi:hypothetical protein